MAALPFVLARRCLSWLGASSLSCGATIIIIVDMFAEGRQSGIFRSNRIFKGTRDIADDISTLVPSPSEAAGATDGCSKRPFFRSCSNFSPNLLNVKTVDELRAAGLNAQVRASVMAVCREVG